MPYCSSVSKMAGFDDHTAEIDSDDVTDEEVILSVHLVRPCAECGSDADEAVLDFNLPIEHQCPDEEWDEKSGEPKPEYEETLDDRTYDLGNVEAEPDENVERTDRHGKPITNPRYMKRLLGAQVSANVTCSRCGEEIELTDSEYIPASSFDGGSQTGH